MLQFVLGFILWIDVCFCYSALQIKKIFRIPPLWQIGLYFFNHAIILWSKSEMCKWFIKEFYFLYIFFCKLHMCILKSKQNIKYRREMLRQL
jgi:hypothetical protein